MRVSSRSRKRPTTAITIKTPEGVAIGEDQAIRVSNQRQKRLELIRQRRLKRLLNLLSQRRIMCVTSQHSPVLAGQFRFYTRLAEQQPVGPRVELKAGTRVAI